VQKIWYKIQKIISRTLTYITYKTYSAYKKLYHVHKHILRKKNYNTYKNL